MLAAEALLYLGGWVVRLRRSLAGVILGRVGSGLGAVLWTVAAGVELFAGVMGM